MVSTRAVYNWAHVRVESWSHKQTDKQTVHLLIWMMDGHLVIVIVLQGSVKGGINHKSNSL